MLVEIETRCYNCGSVKTYSGDEAVGLCNRCGGMVKFIRSGPIGILQGWSEWIYGESGVIWIERCFGR